MKPFLITKDDRFLYGGDCMSAMIKSPSKIVQITRLMPMSQRAALLYWLSASSQFWALYCTRFVEVLCPEIGVCSVAAHGAGRLQQFTVDSNQHHHTMVEKLQN